MNQSKKPVIEIHADTTGSMGETCAAIKKTFTEILEVLRLCDLSLVLGVVGDYDHYYQAKHYGPGGTASLDPSNKTPEEIKTWLDKYLNKGGGGDVPKHILRCYIKYWNLKIQLFFSF